MRITEKAITNLEDIKQKIPDWITEAIILNKEKIFNLLQELQLDKGFAFDGDITLGGSKVYAKSTEEYWAVVFPPKSGYPKKQGSKYNFKWDGDFFNSLDLRVNKQSYEYEIFSLIGEDTRLENIFGGGSLTKFREENNKYVNETIIEPYISTKIVENMFAF